MSFSNPDQTIRNLEREENWGEWLRACLRAGLIKILLMASGETICEFSLPRETLQKAIEALGYIEHYDYVLDRTGFYFNGNLAISLGDQILMLYREPVHHELIGQIFFAPELDPNPRQNSQHLYALDGETFA